MDQNVYRLTVPRSLRNRTRPSLPKSRESLSLGHNPGKIQIADNNQNQVLVFDARVCRTAPVWEFNKEILGVQVSDVIISTEGMAAGAYENRLLIHDLSSVSLKSTDPFFISLLDRKSVDRKLELAQGLTIKNLAFGAKGRWLCAWAISVDQGCDRSYFWEISQQSIDFHGSGCYRRV